MALFRIPDQEILAAARNRKVYDLGLMVARENKVKSFQFHPSTGQIRAEVAGSCLYEVGIKIRANGIVISYHCTCPAYEEYPGACKHVIAVLIIAQNRLAGTQDKQKEAHLAAEGFMALLEKSKQNSARQELKLRLELDLIAEREIRAFLHLKIGFNRLYVVKNLEEFLHAIQQGKPIVFGRNLTFDPAQHAFTAEDQRLIDMLLEMQAQYEALHEMRTESFSRYISSPFRQKPVMINQYYLMKLFDALGDKEFFLSAGTYKAIAASFPRLTQVKREEIPLGFSIQAKDAEMELTISGQRPLQLTSDGRYFLFEQEIYLASEVQQSFLPHLLKILPKQKQPAIRFSTDQQELFASEALPLLGKMGAVTIEPKLAKRFIREDLLAQIYFDRLGECGISARVEFHYGETTINPFSAQPSLSNSTAIERILVRDIEKERKILDIFAQAEFIVSEGLIRLEENERIFDFTVNFLPLLQELTETYSSDDFKLKIRSSTTLSGRIRLDQSSDMLGISFDYSDIDRSELPDIFNSLRLKKKYHRLKDGSYLDLQQPELETVAGLLENLSLQSDSLMNASLQLPKYRAMYIDSFLRQANLPGIQRNIAFKQLVQSILEPQDGEYEIPQKLKTVLRDYQKTGFQWLKTLAAYGLGGVLADDMGLGKTLQVLAFVQAEKSSKLPALVVAPTSLVYNWLAEGEKFVPELNILVVDGTPRERKALLQTLEQRDLVVISYAVLRRDIDHLSRYDFSYCFLDEAQNIKNPQTLNAKSVQRVKAKGFFALTGTPIENSLTELWSLFNTLMPGYLLSHQEFQKKYGLPVIKGDSQALQELSRHTKPFILRRLKKDVLKELPPKIETQITAPLTAEQRKVYLAYLQQTKSQIAQEIAAAGFAKSQIKILAALTRLRQICSHPAMFIENYSGESGKMLLFKEVLAEALAGGHRVLVFSQFTSMLDIIQIYLRGERIAYFYLQGSTKACERSEMTQAFNNGEAQVFLISIKAGGTGLNLTGADTVIHFDPWWNPAVEDQATDRAHRIGQNSTVQVIKLLTQGTIEEKVHALQAKKKKLIDAVIQPGETMLSKMTEEELIQLFEMSNELKK